MADSTKINYQTTETRKTVRLPLYGLHLNRDNTTTKDQRYVNCFPETSKNSVTDLRKFFLVKRPGTSEYLTVLNVPVAFTGPTYLNPYVSYAVSNTGSSPNVDLFDSTNTLITSVALGHDLGGTISQLSFYMLDGTATTRTALTLIPENSGAFGDPMSCYSITEGGAITALYTGLTYSDYYYGPNANLGSFPFNYGGTQFDSVQHFTIQGSTNFVRLFISGYSYPDEAVNIVAAEVVQLSDATILDVYTGTSILTQIYNDYPSLHNMFYI